MVIYPFVDVTAIGGTVTGVIAGDGMTGGGVLSPLHLMLLLHRYDS